MRVQFSLPGCSHGWNSWTPSQLLADTELKLLEIDSLGKQSAAMAKGPYSESSIHLGSELIACPPYLFPLLSCHLTVTFVQ